MNLLIKSFIRHTVYNVSQIIGGAKLDDFVKSRKLTILVIPAKAGTH